MNADDAMNKHIASEQGISSFPTIKFFPKDGSEPVVYNGAREEQDFVEVGHRCVGNASEMRMS
jgi:protein disulfide-isomerase A6